MQHNLDPEEGMTLSHVGKEEKEEAEEDEKEGIILCLAWCCACKASTAGQEQPTLHHCQMFRRIKQLLMPLTSSVAIK